MPKIPPPSHPEHPTSLCHRITVPATACYVRFADAESVGSTVLDFRSARGEMLIGDFDADGRLIGIELVGTGKPCQETRVTVRGSDLRSSEGEP